MVCNNAGGRPSNREFIAMIRRKLDERGHREVTVSRQWIDEETEGYPFLLHVPVGAELAVPLQPRSAFDDSMDTVEIERNAEHFAIALVNLSRAGRMLEKYAGDMRRAAKAEISAARAEGLDLQLVGVGFKPTRAYHLTGSSWKDAATYVLACVKVRNTSFYLRPEVTDVYVAEPSEIADELRSMRQDQRERQDRIAELDASGADLEVDTLTVELLRTHGIDVVEALRDVWRKQCVNLRVEHMGRETWLSLVSFDGKVNSTIELEEAYWNGQYLWFTQEPLFNGHQGSVGKSLGDLVRHPVFASRTVVAVENRLRDHVSFDLSDKLLFDSDTGILRPDDTRLAA